MTFADGIRAALLAAALAAPAGAEGLRGAEPIPGLSFTDARVLARPSEGHYIVKVRPSLRRGTLEAGLARLCGGPSTATYLFRDRDRRPGDATYLVRCRP